MAEYLITKREKCGVVHNMNGIECDVKSADPCFICHNRGYIETTVDLFWVLARLRWNERVFGDGGSSIVHVRGLGTDLRIEE